VQEQNSKRYKQLSSETSHNSLAELRNQSIDTDIPLILSEREPEIINHYEADLLRAEWFVITGSIQLIWPRDGQKYAHGPSRKVFAVFGHLNGISNTI